MHQLTEEEISRAKSVGILSYLQDCEPGNLRKTRTGFCLEDDPYFKIHNGKWYSVEKSLSGRTALGYLTYYRGVDYIEAVKALCDGRPAPVSYISAARAPPKTRKPKPQKPFTLPEANRDNARLISYLCNRGIDKDIIDRCILSGSIYEGITNYEDKEKGVTKRIHNIVYVGKNDDGNACFAALRGIYGDFKQDIEGSDKRYSFVMPPKNDSCNSLAVFESPIDAMSHEMLFKEEDCWRLSLSGFSPLALVYLLEQHPKINRVCLCLDNDEQGNKSTLDIVEQICGNVRFNHISILICQPPTGMDFNEVLKETIKLKKEQEKQSRHKKAAVSL